MGSLLYVLGRRLDVRLVPAPGALAKMRRRRGGTADAPSMCPYAPPRVASSTATAPPVRAAAHRRGVEARPRRTVSRRERAGPAGRLGLSAVPADGPTPRGMRAARRRPRWPRGPPAALGLVVRGGGGGCGLGGFGSETASILQRRKPVYCHLCSFSGLYIRRL